MTNLWRAAILATLLTALATLATEAAKNAPPPAPTSGWTVISLPDGALD